MQNKNYYLNIKVYKNQMQLAVIRNSLKNNYQIIIKSHILFYIAIK